jgi:carboxyl-terminal processing protease
MQKIANFIMSKKFIPIALAILATGVFVAFKTKGNSDNADNPKMHYSKILKNVGILLEEGHYSPRKIDDDFSKIVLKRFVEDLDDEKNIFFQSDISAFKKYETKIDDEIHGSELNSFFDVNTIYIKRLAEVSTLYTEFLDKPFNFTVNETIQLDAEKNTFPKNAVERKDMWRKRIKFLVLSKYTELLEDRVKDKEKKDFVYKADSTLEREARVVVGKQLQRAFTTRISSENMDANFSKFVNDISTTMDPHTDYFAPIDLRSFNEGMKGSFYGIGAGLKEEDGKIKIASLVTGMPAWRSGEVKENDIIIKIAQGKGEAVDVTGYSIADAIKLIRGSEKGTEVVLTFKKVDGSVKAVSLLRDEIVLEDTYAKSAIINGEHKIGYIYLPEFYADFQKADGRRCAADVAKEITKLKAENVEGIVMDLRRNGGGSLYDVVQMAGLFIEGGPIVQVKSRDDKPSVLRDKDITVLYSGPLTVMVDEGSASASEIFAAAIQDYKRGIIVGSTSSYGKGTVQRNIPLNPEAENPMIPIKKGDDLGALKLTLQKFYRINGSTTQLRGVVPDVVLPDRFEFFKIREKDNPYALKFDEIQKADYKIWANSTGINDVITQSNLDANSSSNFKKLKENIQLLDSNLNKLTSLNIKSFQEEQKKLKVIYKNLEANYKLGKNLEVLNIGADTVNIAKTTEKTETNKRFLKSISADIYIDETIKIMYRMIAADKLAVKN